MLIKVVLDNPPSNREQELLREQTIGEIRGLLNVHNRVFNELETINQLATDQDIKLDDIHDSLIEVLRT